jgi:hypothetical protein
MRYIVNMASGEPYPDDAMDHHERQVTQQPHTAPLPDREYTELNLQPVLPQLTHAERSTAAGQHIRALLQSLED